MTAITKTAYAAHRKVALCTISNWLRRGKIRGDALLPGGLIDRETADRQLSETVDPVRQASRPAAAVVDIGPARDLMTAKAASAQIAAERARRALEEMRGHYIIAADAERAWAKVMSGFLDAAEQSLAGLSYDLAGLDDHARLIAIRRWWRKLRARAAEDNQAAAAAEPEFVADAEQAL